MSIIYQCKCCSKSHLAPTQVFQEAAFQSLQMQSYFDNTRYFCPSTGGVKSYAFEDHSWVNEAALTRLCSMIMKWMEETGQIDQLLHETDGELLSPDQHMKHLPSNKPALPQGLVLNAPGKSHIIPKRDPGVLRKAAAG